MANPIQEARDDAWEAFRQEGGTEGKFEARLFGTKAQAYYAGMVVGLDKALDLRRGPLTRIRRMVWSKR